mmetsp:Transcript_10275/g.31415  ORF Transcript_10275/g.31415 Transcript_10275/m.31415 type:complete len:197 (+) Transcript_10275:105-695(+)
MTPPKLALLELPDPEEIFVGELTLTPRTNKCRDYLDKDYADRDAEGRSKKPTTPRPADRATAEQEWEGQRCIWDRAHREELRANASMPIAFASDRFSDVTHFDSLDSSSRIESSYSLNKSQMFELHEQIRRQRDAMSQELYSCSVESDTTEKSTRIAKLAEGDRHERRNTLRNAWRPLVSKICRKYSNTSARQHTC